MKIRAIIINLKSIKDFFLLLNLLFCLVNLSFAQITLRRNIDLNESWKTVYAVIDTNTYNSFNAAK